MEKAIPRHSSLPWLGVGEEGQRTGAYKATTGGAWSLELVYHLTQNVARAIPGSRLKHPLGE